MYSREKEQKFINVWGTIIPVPRVLYKPVINWHFKMTNLFTGLESLGQKYNHNTFVLFVCLHGAPSYNWVSKFLGVYSHILVRQDFKKLVLLLLDVCTFSCKVSTPNKTFPVLLVLKPSPNSSIPIAWITDFAAKPRQLQHMCGHWILYENLFLSLERIQIRASRRDSHRHRQQRYGSSVFRHVDVWSCCVVCVIIKGYYGQHELVDAGLWS